MGGGHTQDAALLQEVHDAPTQSVPLNTPLVVDALATQAAEDPPDPSPGDDGPPPLLPVGTAALPVPADIAVEKCSAAVAVIGMEESSVRITSMKNVASSEPLADVKDAVSGDDE